jgi:hypothetical protein
MLCQDREHQYFIQLLGAYRLVDAIWSPKLQTIDVESALETEILKIKVA